MFRSASSRHLLLVGVNADTSRVTKASLTKAGYQVTSVPGFEDACKVMSRGHPDLLLTAVRLGRFNGLHLAVRCQWNHPQLPVIVLAGQGDEGLMEDAARLGARFLTAAAPSQVLALVAELLAPSPALATG
jgi:DNA-binding NtrC family response regulator